MKLTQLVLPHLKNAGLLIPLSPVTITTLEIGPDDRHVDQSDTKNSNCSPVICWDKGVVLIDTVHLMGKNHANHLGYLMHWFLDVRYFISLQTSVHECILFVCRVGGMFFFWGQFGIEKNTITHPKTNISSENGWLEDKPASFWVSAYFQGRDMLVLGRVTKLKPFRCIDVWPLGKFESSNLNLFQRKEFPGSSFELNLPGSWLQLKPLKLYRDPKGSRIIFQLSFFGLRVLKLRFCSWFF